MLSLMFVLALAAFSTVLLVWSFRTLPGEGWQILASMPMAKDDSGRWKGLNLTYYGLFTANAYGFALAVLFVLMGSLHVPMQRRSRWSRRCCCCGVPASRFIARAVRKEILHLYGWGSILRGDSGHPLDHQHRPRRNGGCSHLRHSALSAISISYAFGEGMGRLACISFGCCYGKPLSQSHPILRRVIENLSFTFHGKTKKIASMRAAWTARR